MSNFSMQRIKPEDCQQAIALSEAVYLSRQEATDVATRLGYRVSHIGNNGGPRVMVCSNDDETIVVIRGTDVGDWFDLVSDIRFWPRRDYQGGYVHRGFYNYCDAVWMQVEPVVLAANSQRLTFVGHSLGGAAAVIMATWSGVLRRLAGAPLAHVVTIGAPRVATRGFLKMTAAQTSGVARITNNLDSVPYLPWPIYHHPKAEHYFIHGDGRVLRNPTLQTRIRNVGRGLWKRLMKLSWYCVRYRSLARAVKEVGSDSDHRITKYKERFDAWMAG
ncbi:MAG: lipase family protein [Fuerstiella sp.]